MMTIVTHVYLKEGAGPDWDGAMRTRLSTAKKRPGWIAGQLLRPTDRPDRRVIVGTWRTVTDWEAWHQDSQFAATRQRLDGLESTPAVHWWHDVVLDVRKAVTPAGPASKASNQRRTKGKTKSRRHLGYRKEFCRLACLLSSMVEKA